MKPVKVAFYLILSALSLAITALVAQGGERTIVQRGEYVFRASGGCACHTEVKNQGRFMAGGRPIQTPFGDVFSTNITPDPQTGIGTWSDADFVRAMTRGVAPDGAHYFPVFPYTSFTYMTEPDLLALKAYLFSIPPVRQPNKPPALRFPFNWRTPVAFWKWLYFEPGPFRPDPSRPDAWNRGAYLATALAHCGECHTPRNLLGGPKRGMAYAGSVDGPEGELAPNITPDEETGIGSWSIPDFVWFMQTGLKPNGDDAQGLMAELIENGYQHLTESDLQAIAVYLQSLKPIRNRLVVKDTR